MTSGADGASAASRIREYRLCVEQLPAPQYSMFASGAMACAACTSRCYSVVQAEGPPQREVSGSCGA